jgi:alpha-tubulin suppressor-like RCC1 family protein
MRSAALVIFLAGCHDWEALSSGEPRATVAACVAYVVGGDSHTCARTTDGALLCWGDNRFGQLGTGDREPRSGPVTAALAGESVTRVYLPAGSGDITADRAVYTCAVTTTTALICWGDNRAGQLGIGKTEPQPKPVAVSGLGSGVARAAAGGGHACAQTSDGALFCWGSNTNGQLGTGDLAQRLEPTRVDTTKLASSVDAVACGGSYTCARSDERIYCWGANEHGQLGIGSPAGASTPTELAVLGSDVTRLSTGANHACAFTAEGQAWCWGSNVFGQLGTSDTKARNRPTEADSSELGKVSWISAGGQHTCAIASPDSTLWCWGDNRFGQLGTGDTKPRFAPAQVLALGDQVSDVYSGGSHTCAKKADGSVWCWGNNQYRQVGADVGAQTTEPVRVFAGCD